MPYWAVREVRARRYEFTEIVFIAAEAVIAITMLLAGGELVADPIGRAEKTGRTIEVRQTANGQLAHAGRVACIAIGAVEIE